MEELEKFDNAFLEWRCRANKMRRLMDVPRFVLLYELFPPPRKEKSLVEGRELNELYSS